MRVRKIRGCTRDRGKGSEWITGTGVRVTPLTDEYTKHVGKSEKVHIWTEKGWIEVVKKSVGNFTCREDVNGVDVYEGSIVKIGNEEPYSNAQITTDYDWEMVMEVVFDDYGFVLRNSESGIFLSECEREDIRLEVIGNIYENPELLKSGKTTLQG